LATIEDFIYYRLANTSAVSAIVGSRIYRLKMPDNPTLPAITFETTVGDFIESFEGSSGLRNPVMRIHCWATTAGVAQDLAEKVRVAMHGYRGTYSDRVIQNILEWSTMELFDHEIEIFHVAATCRVWYY
jgi:hypothetical protein